MKKTLSLLLASLMFGFAAQAEVNKEVRPTDEFTAIEASKGVNISLIQCDKWELEVVTDGCPTSDVETNVKKGVLYVKMGKRTPGSAVQVFIYFKDVNRVDVKSGASVDTECLFQHKGLFELGVGAKCEAEMEIEVDELSVDANTCSVTMSGSAKKQTVSMAGTVGDSRYDAGSLTCETAEVAVTGAEAIVKFTESLTAEAVGGTIRYIGDSSKVNAEAKFGGSISKY